MNTSSQTRNTKTQSLSRRGFLKTALFGAGLAVQQFAFPRIVFGQSATVSVGVIGCGPRGSSIIRDLIAYGRANILALCEVDNSRLSAQAKVVQDAGSPGVLLYRNYRDLLDRRDIDAVVVATPTHWLAKITHDACCVAKDVLVETPASHTVYEGKVLLDTAQSRGRVVHVGAQRRLDPGTRRAIEWVKNGNLGKIKVARVICYLPRKSIGSVTNAIVPSTLDYDLWLGPALMEPYGSATEHYKWRFNSNTGCGELGNEAYQMIDLGRWALSKDQFPNRVVSIGGRFGYTDRGSTPNTMLVLHDYLDCALITEIRALPAAQNFQAMTDWAPYMDTYSGMSYGLVLECESGLVVNNRAIDPAGRVIREFGGIDRIVRQAGGVEITFEGQLLTSTQATGPYTAVSNAVSPYSASTSEPQRFWRVQGPNAVSAFVDNMLNRTDPQASLREGRLSGALVHTGNISYRLGTPTSVANIRSAVSGDLRLATAFERMLTHLERNGVDLAATPLTLGPSLAIDPTPMAEQFIQNSTANALLTKSYRSPWTM